MDEHTAQSASTPADTYESLTHVAWEWNVPLRTVIRELEKAGYRYSGVPTRKALNEGLANRRCKGGGYHWSRLRVGEFIEGHIDADKPVAPKRYVVVPIIIE